MFTLAYASFDVFPSPKGAATHIAAFTRALGQAFGEVELFTVAPSPKAPDIGPEIPPHVHHHPLAVTGGNMVERALSFRCALLEGLGGRRFSVFHIRSIFEGYPLARGKDEFCDHLVYEVNGLPSIELKYHFPAVGDDREFLHKLTVQEDCCLAAADLIVTPSGVTAEHLQERGVPREKIKVIPNGVDLARFPFRQPEERNPGDPLRLLYAGTMTAWQGVNQALEALALYRRDDPAELTLVGPVRSRQKRRLLDRAADLGIAEHVTILDPVGQEELALLHHFHDLTLAPLLPNDRNLVQGCCPIKVLEAMACGSPLIASDLPVVTDLTGESALLVRPGSAKAIKDAMLLLRDDPGLGKELARPARKKVETNFTWDLAGEALVAAYGGLGVDFNRVD